MRCPVCQVDEVVPVPWFADVFRCRPLDNRQYVGLQQRVRHHTDATRRRRPASVGCDRAANYQGRLLCCDSKCLRDPWLEFTMTDRECVTMTITARRWLTGRQQCLVERQIADSKCADIRRHSPSLRSP